MTEADSAGLAEAFPSRLRTGVRQALGNLTMSFPACPGVSAVIDGQRLEIPYRVYFSSRRPRLGGDRVENTISRCMFTRHNDGFVRQENLAGLLAEERVEYFAVPFILKLAEEYVLDITQLVLSRIGCIAEEDLRRFLRENPRWTEKMNARCVSYWNCYYRLMSSGGYPAYLEYPGARLVAFLMKMQSTAQEDIPGPIDEPGPIRRASRDRL